MGENSILEARAYLGRGSSIGADCRLMPGAIVMDGCGLGKRVIVHAGAVIGADGFGYDSDASGHAKIPQVGGVSVGDDVEIGAGTTVDRARFSQTIIGEGTKIDNLVQIGHNVRIGRHCLICAQVGIAGSTTLEDFVVLGGQVGVAGHLRLGAGSQAGAQSGIGRSLEPRSTVFGSPAVPYLLRQKISILQQRLPDLFRRVDKIEAGLEKAFENPVEKG
jgi:UDP-3-O-[3-hydroxymyristoyl] glucosamine N-acyltransferase